MSPLQFHSKKGFSAILPAISTFDKAILVGLELSWDGKQYEILFYKTLSENFRDEIFKSFLEYKQTTHYFINNVADPQAAREFILEIENILNTQRGIMII